MVAELVAVTDVVPVEPLRLERSEEPFDHPVSPC